MNRTLGRSVAPLRLEPLPLPQPRPTTEPAHPLRENDEPGAICGVTRRSGGVVLISRGADRVNGDGVAGGGDALCGYRPACLR